MDWGHFFPGPIFADSRSQHARAYVSLCTVSFPDCVYACMVWEGGDTAAASRVAQRSISGSWLRHGDHHQN